MLSPLLSDPTTMLEFVELMVIKCSLILMSGMWVGVAAKANRLGACLMGIGALLSFCFIDSPVPAGELKATVASLLTQVGYLLLVVGSVVEGRRIIADHAALRAARQDEERT